MRVFGSGINNDSDNKTVAAMLQIVDSLVSEPYCGDLPSKENQRLTRDFVDEALSLAGIDLDVDHVLSMSYSDYYDHVLNGILLKLCDKDFITLFDALWDNANSTQFVVPFRYLDELKMPEDLRVDLPDMTLNFKNEDGSYSRLFCKCSKLEDNLVINDKEHSLYSIQLFIILPDWVEKEVGVRQYTVFNFLYSPTRYPRLYGDGIQCKCCKNSNVVKVRLHSSTSGVLIDDAMCLSGRVKSDCCRFRKYFINSEQLLAVIYYVADLYIHRGSLMRKNGKRKEAYKQRTVSVYNRDNVVRLHEFNGTHGTHFGGYHSSHSSPMEHRRRAHTRTYKSGKIVNVGETIVNKGKGKVIYECK